jgi:predicted nucleotidyltransferase
MPAEPTWETFREAVRSRIAEELEREARDAAAARAAVLPRVREAVAEGRARGECGRVILFGSFAWGEPREGSDIDLLIEDERDGKISSAVAMRTLRLVHAVPWPEAPESLRERALREGIEL